MTTTEVALELEVILPSLRFTLGEPIACTVRLVNTGGRAVWLNRRLLFNTVHAPAAYRELWVDMQGPGGKRLDFQRKIRVGPATAQHFGVLAPGAVIEASLALTRNFDMAAPGDYAFVVSYQDGCSEAPPAPAQTQVFAGKLRSEVVELKLVPPEKGL